MKKVLLGLFLVAFVFGAAGVAVGMASKKHDTAKAKATACYTCDKCGTVAMQAGKCPKCGAEMTQKHVLAVKEGTAYLCTCVGDCECTLKGTDMTKCSCGKPIASVPLKGMYVCGCGPDCKCNTIADKPGKCGCGKDLKKVE